MSHKKFGPFKVIRRNGHYDKLPDGGTRWVEDQPTDHDVEIVIDIEAIARSLGPRSVRNKSRTARYLGGDLIVREVRS